jgi:hypothetical protein
MPAKVGGKSPILDGKRETTTISSLP